MGSPLQFPAQRQHPVPKSAGRFPDARSKAQPHRLRQRGPPPQKSLPIPTQQIPVPLNPAILLLPGHERRHRHHAHVPIRQAKRRQATRGQAASRTNESSHPHLLLKIAHPPWIVSMPRQPKRVPAARATQGSRDPAMGLGADIAFGRMIGQDDHLHNDSLPSHLPEMNPALARVRGDFPLPPPLDPRHGGLCPPNPLGFDALDCHPYSGTRASLQGES